MERALLLHMHPHRLHSSNAHSSASSFTAALRPLHLSALSPSLPPVHSPPRLRLLLPCRASFRSFFLASLPFLPFPLIPRCPKHSHLPIASISSSAFAAGAGGGGLGPGGGSGGGGGGNGGSDGFGRGTGTQALGSESDDIPLTNSVEDFVFLDVGGMSCGGCASSVKKILESQPYVLHASVNLATETAVVKVSLSPEIIPGKTKLDVGEALAKHLSGCGFKSSVREEPVGS
eukprot:c22107_g1_i2 orf=99-794(+)